MDSQQFKFSCDNFKKSFLNKAKGNVTKACLVILKDAKKNCPLDQLDIKDNMFYSVVLDSNKVVGTVGNTLEKSVHLHQGTGVYVKNKNGEKVPIKYNKSRNKNDNSKGRNIGAPNPFLQKALVNNMSKIQEVLKEGLL
ncbi:hypothetical protein [Clostridium oceanicum]|uniref:HK97 gp10 family phage protein n=1 Tax=Clostridium oceanicum TaxID=1543 RepID=A0ABN1JBY4_9CLOT